MKSDRSKVLFDAITGIDEDLIDEAASPSRLHPARPILRVAAIAAVLVLVITALLWPKEENYVTGPGILVARAYELEEPFLSEENSTILEEGITLPLSYNWTPAISVASQGLPLDLSIDADELQGKDITFEIMVSDGSFYQSAHSHVESIIDGIKQTYLGNSFRIGNQRRIYWDPGLLEIDDQTQEISYTPLSGNHAFANIIIRADKWIIGYAVIEFYEVNGLSGEKGWYYNARMLKSVSFPQINGDFQRVSEKYIAEQFQLIHETAQ